MRERQKFSPANLTAVAGLLLLAGLLIIPRLSWAAFSEPGTTPLTGAPPTFLNGSGITQTKLGTFFIGPSGGTAVFCLNSNPTLSIHNPNNNDQNGTKACISSWSDIAGAASYVRRQQNAVIGNPLNPTTYGTADRGFATVIGNTASDCNPGGITPCNQGISTVVKVNLASTTSPRYAVYATDGGVNTRSAAQLSGRTYIFKPPGSPAQELCLNGQCITQWNGAFLFGIADNVRVQNTVTLTSDIGSASVSGALLFRRSLTIGRPMAITPAAQTMGDGQCTDENGEDTIDPNAC